MQVRDPTREMVEAGKFILVNRLALIVFISTVFNDRIRTQNEIQDLLNVVFNKRETIDAKQFIEICTTVSSDIFLAIIIFLMNSIPCTTNFFVYKSNYEKCMNSEGTKQSPKLIQAPRFMRSLSTLSSLSSGFLDFKQARGHTEVDSI